MNFWTFTKSNSKLNYKCVIVWLQKVEKIILSYLGRIICSIHKKSSKIQPLSMNIHADNVNPILQKVKENEKRAKKCNPFACSPFMCTNFQ